MSLSPGARLGPYEILSPIGAGGMGEVYRARDTRLGREVAIKVLHGAVARDADLLRRFEQEARAAGLLNHPNITAVYDIGRHEGSTYVVQELLEGKTLQVALREGPLSPRRAIDYAVQIAHGLAAAHEKGIIHRDLKPANLFLTRDGRVKILDFGLAKLVGPEISSPPQTDLPTASPSTKPGVLLGTIGYMSPEQLRGQSGEDRSDIFSFGVVLYEMLSGSQPFLRSSPADTMMAILSESPLPLTRAGISAPLNRLVSRCLEKGVDVRFQHARDVAFALESTRLLEVGFRRPGLKWTLAAAAVIALLAGAAVLRRRVQPTETARTVLLPTALPPLAISPSESRVVRDPTPAVQRPSPSTRAADVRPTATRHVAGPT